MTLCLSKHLDTNKTCIVSGLGAASLGRLAGTQDSAEFHLCEIMFSESGI